MPPVRCRYCGELRGSGWSHCSGPTGDHDFYEQRPCAAAGPRGDMPAKPQIERLKAEIARAEDRIKTLEAENGPLRRDLEHAQSTLADYEQILDQGRAENERLRSGLDHNLKLIKHLQASDLHAEVERLSLDNRRLTEMWDADRETLTDEIEQEKQHCDEWHYRAEIAEDEVKRLRNESMRWKTMAEEKHADLVSQLREIKRLCVALDQIANTEGDIHSSWHVWAARQALGRAKE